MKRISWWPIVGAVLVVALLGGFVLAFAGGEGSDSAARFDPELTSGDVGAIQLGTSRDEIEERIGPGQDALEFEQTGAAVEPMDAACAYYDADSLARVAQLCYRDERLVSKRTYRSAFDPER